MNQYTINVSVSVSDPKIREEIEKCFVAHFGGIGSDETREHFVARKTEEWIVSIYANKKAEVAVSNLHQATIEAVRTSATIKQQLNKPEESEVKE